MTEYDATYRRAKGHHFLQHDLPRLSQKAVLTLIGATSITEALHWLHSKKPADLRAMFEIVYKASTNSQNKRWLQRRLAEALKLRPSQYFPLGQKAIGQKRSTKAGLVSSPSTSSAVALALATAKAGPVEVQPVRKSTRIPKRRAFAKLACVGEQPSTPTAAEVDAPFSDRFSGNQSAEEGNDDSETGVASPESPENQPAASGSAGGEGFTSGLSFFLACPRVAMPPPPAPARIPPSKSAAAFKLLSSRDPGARTKDSAAEVAAIVAAKRKLKAFLPGYPLASETQVADVFNKACMQVTPSVPTLPITDAASIAEYIYGGPVYPSIVKQPSAALGSGEELNSIVVGEVENNIAATASATTLIPMGDGVLPEEDEDKIFMHLDPVLVDLDMSLMPDGRMW